MRVRWCHILLVMILLAFGALACGLPGEAKPTVVVNSPPSNYKISEGEELAVDVTATGGGDIEWVELRVDGAVVDEAVNPTPQQVFNVELVWVAAGAGEHDLEVRAYNTEDQGSDAVGIIIEVEGEVALATGTAEVGPFATPSPGETPSPTATASATLTATATATATPTATSTATATATATTPPAPVLNFWADPNPVNQGQPFTLHWHEDYASAIYLTGPEVGTNVGVTGPDGSKAVCSGSVGCPAAGDRTYTLRGEGPGGTTQIQVVVHIVPPALAVSWAFFGSPQYGGTSGDHAGWLCMQVRNTGSVAFESVRAHVINTVTSGTLYGPLAYSDTPWRSTVFMGGPDITRLEPGQEAWSCYKLAGYPPHGTPVGVTLWFYTQDGKAGTEVPRSWEFNLP